MGRPLLRDEVPVGPCKVRALFSWSGETPQDLGFVEGDIIEVLNSGDGDWWTGKLKRNKLVGVFPRNFAEYVNEDQETMSAALTEKRKKSKLTNYTLETCGDPIDFSSFSLADLQIPDPNACSEEPARSAALPKHSSSFIPSVPPTTTSGRNINKGHLQSSQNSQTSNSSGKEFKYLSPLGGSANSNRSTKSAKEILDDVAKEINGGFLDDINLDVKPEDLRTPELCDDGFEFPSFDLSGSKVNGDNRSVALSDYKLPYEENNNGPPVPPPHKVSVNSSKMRHSRDTSLVPHEPMSPGEQNKKSSALTGPVIDTSLKFETELGGLNIKDPRGNYISTAAEDLRLKSLDLQLDRSPNLEQEVPFDPKSFKTEKSIGDHIGSHFDDAAYSSTNLTSKASSVKDTEEPVVLQKLRGSKNESQKSAVNDNVPNSTVFFPKKGGETDSKKTNFFQRLFPKNSQTFLRRSFSRSSHKSSKSTNTVTSKLRNVKSMFSFGFTPDESLYPTNNLNSTKKDKAQSIHPPLNTTPSIGPPEVKRISTPPRANLAGLGLGTPIRSVDNRGSTALGSSLGGVAGGSSKEPLAGKWIETRRNLYRAKTLTERDVLKRRQELELQGVNSENLVEMINEQNAMEFHDYRLENFEEVDHAVRTMSTWPQLMTPSVFASSRIGRHFRDPAERIRAVFLLCATRIQHVSQTASGNNVMQSRIATPAELAATVEAMCSALNIECVQIEGHRRVAVPGSKTISSIPHAWNAVHINGEWRLIDCITAAAASMPPVSMKTGSTNSHHAVDSNLADGDEDDEVNLFYFLTPPSQLLYSHVPNDHHLQFCNPALPTSTAVLLPLASPAAFAHNIHFDEFWLGMTRLSDLEVAELNLQTPDASEDLVAIVDGQYPALAQAYWSPKDNARHFRVKAFVPPHLKQAILQIYVVPKSQISRTPENMELIWTVELRHVSGGKNNSHFEFAGRYAAPSAEEYDMYIIEPQCRTLGGGDTYTFKIESFDAYKTHTRKQRHARQPKVAMQSPSGRVTRLVPFGTDVHDTFRATVKTLEVGTWRAVIRADENQSWVPFAEWFCS